MNSTLTGPDLGTGTSLPGMSSDPFRHDLCSDERLEHVAHRLAHSGAGVSSKTSSAFFRALGRIDRELQKARTTLSRLTRTPEPLSQDSQWFLDNWHIIQESVREVWTDLPRSYYRKLPAQPVGPYAGWPRTFELAAVLVAHTDSVLVTSQIHRFVHAYQEAYPLTIGELWAVPTMLRVALLENLRRLAQRTVRAHLDRARAEAWVASGGRAFALPDAPSDDFVVGLTQSVRDAADSGLVGRLRDWTVGRGIDVDAIQRRERQRLASDQVSIGNCVTSLRLLRALDWKEFFEQASAVELVLRTDPGRVYPGQDFATRDACRQVIEQLARGSKHTEVELAEKVVERAASAVGDPRRGQVSYWLLDAGLDEMEAAVGYRPAWGDGWRQALRRRPNLVYFGTLGTLTLALVAVLLFLLPPLPQGVLAAVVALALLPLSEMALALVNTLISHLLKPRVLPRMDFRQGIPADHATFVVVPCMLTRPEVIRGLVERLELHYLANPDPNLRFALLSDFADAAHETLPTDEPLLRQAQDLIAGLNARHAAGKPPQFYLFHRRRRYDPSEGCWMGWERKRGKLTEFNRLIRNPADPTLSYLPVDLSGLPPIEYVITLDADTVLPREAAARMIGTIAHPLNAPVLAADRRTVVAGYGVLQPRVTFLYQSGLQSWFAWLFAGSAGLDPYSLAASDPYMDLFDKGSFTGKGLYHLDAFEAVTGEAFPENHILSHDLIEGNFARCGLVTDVEVYDGFPAKYHAYARREHRWIRGDWQLLPWLLPTVPTRAGARRPNVLGLLERWKVADNLRRSLVPPALVLGLALGWLMLPVSPLAVSLFALAVLATPLVIQIAHTLQAALTGMPPRALVRQAHLSVGNTAGQIVLTACFLASQAAASVDAILRTLWRLCVSRRHLLEWETAAATETRLGNGPAAFFAQMWPGTALAVLVAATLACLRPEALAGAAPWLLAWAISPLIAWLISLPSRPRSVPVTAEERRALRRLARKTWLFFERFVGAQDNGLPPDNYQEVPGAKVAHRTSPTNIGLYLTSTLAAHDLGYLPLSRVADRLEMTFDTLDRLEKYRGHLLNWYDTESLRPLPPAYVSTVDSGNFLGCLLTLEHGLLEKLREPIPAPALLGGLADTLALVEEHARVPSRLDWLLEEVAAVRAAISVTPNGLPDWFSLLDALDKRVAGWKERLDQADPQTMVAQWVTRLGELIASTRQEIDALYPWFAAVGPRQVADLAAGVDEEARALLTQPSSLADWEKQADTVRARLARRPDAASGKLVAALDAATASGLAGRLRGLAKRAAALAGGMDFRFLYNRDRDLFAIGFHVPLERLDNAHYDLLASEACLTSFLMVACGQAPRKHWLQLDRPTISVRGQLGLLSWGGTMFEYLMPRLFLPVVPGTLLDTMHRTAVRRQMQYGRETGTPWGVSESAYLRFDGDQNYQYQAFGVPGLGLKRGLGNELVVAPYACAMAVPVEPRAALTNLARLAAVGAEGPYGLYEAIDYTPERLSPGKQYQVIQSYMAHHQGMSLLAVTNRLLGDPMARRLRQVAMVRAVETLLHERAPYEAPLAPVEKRPEGPLPGAEEAPAVVRRITAPDTLSPRPHFLSNSSYTVMVTNAGGGYSRWRDLDVTRWRLDPTNDPAGQFVYIRDLTNKTAWSLPHVPLRRPPSAYEVLFSIDKAEFRRRDGAIETVTEIVVSPEKDVEVRRIKATNHGTRAVELEFISYLEPVLLPHAADLAHPAFGKLFLETEWLPGSTGLLCRRRPRSTEQKAVWAIHVLATDRPGHVRYETDRNRFLGRRRSHVDPAALGPDAAGRNGTSGPVLDPVLSIRYRVRIEPSSSILLAYSTGAAGNRAEALRLAEQYHNLAAVNRTFDLAWAHGQVALQQLGIDARQAHVFQRLAGYCLFPTPALRSPDASHCANRLGQQGLWPMGISGDYPIILVRLEKVEGVELLRDLVMAQRYLRSQGLILDVVILDETPTGYRDDLRARMSELSLAIPGGQAGERTPHLFLLKNDQIGDQDRTLLLASARVILTGSERLSEQVNVLDPGRPLPPRLRPVRAAATQKPATLLHGEGQEELQFDNTFGGFSQDGREYVLRAGAIPPAPWVNVIANPTFGTLVSDAGSGFTWAVNSQLNRITPWSNDPVLDPPCEVIYLRDDDTGEWWNPTPLPAGGPTEVRHGQGLTRFLQRRGTLTTELTVFVGMKDPVKFYRLRIRNQGNARRLSLAFLVELILGTTTELSAEHLVLEEDPATGALFARNCWQPEFGERVTFIDVTRRPRTLSGDRGEFLGPLGSIRTPEAMRRTALSGRTTHAVDPCAALMVPMEVAEDGQEDVVFLIGQAEDRTAARQLVAKYAIVQAADAALDEVVRTWDVMLGTIQVRTSDPALDLLVNRWLLYQVLSCRLWGRSAFYQSGGAYGFRDQLQDVMALVYARPDEARAQILRAAARQFSEGDVQHWWHPPVGRGVRTRISDDYLFLPFVVAFYVRVTGDSELLDVPVTFLRAPRLAEGEHEMYGLPEVTNEAAPIYEHCKRALDLGWRLGSHGLPLMGCGDWNDGMNRVGAAGRGESVWVGWFLAACLHDFGQLATQRGDQPLAAEYARRREQLRQALENYAWDGRWYRRAYFDDGTPLGSATNEECQIDNIAQSWAVLSGVANPERAATALDAAVESLVRANERLILLFTPPFDRTPLDPGYIKGYVPGIRENGGQYTHAAVWLVQALARVGWGDEALTTFDLLNPIRHADTADKAAVYRIEPYVAAGDIYGWPPHVGRGGWSWYTGSAAWLYRAAVEDLLGFRKIGTTLRITPCLPAGWPAYEIAYRHGTTPYRIRVEPAGEGEPLSAFTLDGQPVDGDIPLADDGRPHAVTVRWRAKDGNKDRVTG
ncbi:MAG: glucoamylase family protein [Gemmataceae bacterium]